MRKYILIIILIGITPYIFHISSARGIDTFSPLPSRTFGDTPQKIPTSNFGQFAHGVSNQILNNGKVNPLSSGNGELPQAESYKDGSLALDFSGIQSKDSIDIKPHPLAGWDPDIGKACYHQDKLMDIATTTKYVDTRIWAVNQLIEYFPDSTTANFLHDYALELKDGKWTLDENITTDGLRTVLNNDFALKNGLSDEIVKITTRSNPGRLVDVYKNEQTFKKLKEKIAKGLIGTFANTEKSGLKVSIAETLRKIVESNHEIIETLTDTLLQHEKSSIKEAAAEIFVRMGTQGMQWLLNNLNLLSEGKELKNYKQAINLLIDNLNNENSSIKETTTLVLEKIGEPAVSSLIAALNKSDFKEGAKEALIKIGNPSFIPVVEKLLNSDNPKLQQQAAEIIKGIAKKKPGQESGIDPNVNITSLNSMGKEELEDIVSNNDYSITRAIALYYLGKNYDDKGFLQDYLFNVGGNDELYVKDKDITKLEMSAILNTEIPANSGWWDKLANKDEKIKYVKLVLKGDFTDERTYIKYGRNWVCVQFATQLVMNFNGYNKDNFADKESFVEYGAGYIIPSLKGYGIPIYYAVDPYHAFNAVFIGEDFTDDLQLLDAKNWLFIEPQQDDFSPVTFANDISVDVLSDPDVLFLPDGEHGGKYEDSSIITVYIKSIFNYPYGDN